MPKPRKMVNLKIEETSGVDHPAHLHEGWIVCKSADANTIEGLFGGLNLTKEETVPELENTDTTQGTEGTEESTEETQVETVPKSDYDAIVAERDALQTAAAAESDATEDEGTEGQSDFEKALNSMPEPVREFLRKQAADTEAAQAELRKERDARLDEQAITKSRETFKSIAIAHDTVAPALRRVALIDADLAKAVETALTAADAQLHESGLFTETGSVAKSEGGKGAYEAIVSKAEELVKAGEFKTVEQAFGKALSDNPELHNAYLAEKAGK